MESGKEQAMTPPPYSLESAPPYVKASAPLLLERPQQQPQLLFAAPPSSSPIVIVTTAGRSGLTICKHCQVAQLLRFLHKYCGRNSKFKSFRNAVPKDRI